MFVLVLGGGGGGGDINVIGMCLQWLLNLVLSIYSTLVLFLLSCNLMEFGISHVFWCMLTTALICDNIKSPFNPWILRRIPILSSQCSEVHIYVQTWRKLISWWWTELPGGLLFSLHKYMNHTYRKRRMCQQFELKSGCHFLSFDFAV